MNSNNGRRSPGGACQSGIGGERVNGGERVIGRDGEASSYLAEGGGDLHIQKSKPRTMWSL